MTTWLVGVGGFCLGLVVGVVFHDALVEMRREQHMDRPRRHRLWTWLQHNILALLIVVVAGLQAMVGVMLITTRTEVGDLSRCQASYNQAFSVAYRTRLEAALESRDKLNAVFFTVIRAIHSDDPDDSAAFQQALAEYVRAERAYDRERRTNPLPPLPNTYCEDY